LIGFSDLNERFVGQSDFYGLRFMQCVHGQLLFGDDCAGKVCRLAAGVRSVCETSKQAVNLSVHQDG
jgi:hypothetical protein